MMEYPRTALQPVKGSAQEGHEEKKIPSLETIPKQRLSLPLFRNGLLRVTSTFWIRIQNESRVEAVTRCISWPNDTDLGLRVHLR